MCPRLSGSAITHVENVDVLLIELPALALGTDGELRDRVVVVSNEIVQFKAE